MTKVYLCTIHFGAPVVPLLYMMNRGWEKGTCRDGRGEGGERERRGNREMRGK